jgi:hypothetical protein
MRTTKGNIMGVDCELRIAASHNRFSCRADWFNTEVGLKETWPPAHIRAAY